MKRFSVALTLVCMAFLLGHQAYAQSGTRGGFGIGAGVVKFADTGDSDESSHPLWVTANLRVKLNPNFAIEPEAGWYRQSFGTDDHTDVINFGGSALLILPAEQFELFGGGGAGGHYFRTAFGSSTSTTTKFGYHFLGGVELKATDSLNLFGAVRYEIVRAGDSSSDNLKQWKFYAGLRFTTN